MTLTKGTLVWVTPAEGDEHLVKIIDRNGHLWTVDGPATNVPNDALNSNFYWCKALATGMLFDWHINEMKEEENAHPAG